MRYSQAVPDIVLFTGDRTVRAKRWQALPPEEKLRAAVQACRDRDLEGLWAIEEAYISNNSQAGGTLSDNTAKTYRFALQALLGEWAGVNLLRATKDDALAAVRAWQASGISSSTVQVRLAGARWLYRSLRDAGATEADPFREIRTAPDHTAPYDRRKPYPDADIEKMLAVADPVDALLVLLCAHAGLRVSEALAVTTDDVDLAESTLTVRHGKGGRRRVVHISRRLSLAIVDELQHRSAGDTLLPLTSRTQAHRHITSLCRRAGLKARGVHALRHSCGTRLYAETQKLEQAQRHLGHASISTTQAYAHWSDTEIQKTVQDW